MKQTNMEELEILINVFSSMDFDSVFYNPIRLRLQEELNNFLEPLSVKVSIALEDKYIHLERTK